MAYDHGYAALGGPAPIFVQAKPSWSRPGSVTGAAVLAFVLAGLAVVAAIFWLASRDILQSANEAGMDTGSYVDEALVNGVANILIGICFMAGAIGALSRQPWGRLVLMATAGLHIAYLVYRIAFGNYVSIMYIFMDATIIVLLAMPQVSRFFATEDPLMAPLR